MDEQIKRLKQKVGELVLDIDILKEAHKGRPFDRGWATNERLSPRPSGRPACRPLEVARTALLKRSWRPEGYAESSGWARLATGSDRAQSPPPPDASSQLTRSALASMTPEQINEARKAGRLDWLLAGRWEARY